MQIKIIFTNGEIELRDVYQWTKDYHGVYWFFTLDKLWERTFCARTVTRVR